MTVWQCLVYPICHTFFLVLYNNVFGLLHNAMCTLLSSSSSSEPRGSLGHHKWFCNQFLFCFFLHFPWSFDIVCVIMYNIAFIDLFSKIVGRFLYLHLFPSWDLWRDIRSRLLPPCRVLNSSMLKHFPRRKPLVTFFFFFWGGSAGLSACHFPWLYHAQSHHVLSTNHSSWS